MQITIPDKNPPKNCIICRFLHRDACSNPDRCILARKKFQLNHYDLSKKPMWCPYNSKNEDIS